MISLSLGGCNMTTCHKVSSRAVLAQMSSALHENLILFAEVMQMLFISMLSAPPCLPLCAVFLLSRSFPNRLVAKHDPVRNLILLGLSFHPYGLPPTYLNLHQLWYWFGCFTVSFTQTTTHTHTTVGCAFALSLSSPCATAGSCFAVSLLAPC